MCGFFGVFPQNYPLKKGIKDKIIDILKYRGPDYQGELWKENLYLIASRLKIFGEENPPYITKDRQWIGMFNGEIYNFKDLATDYLPKSALQTELALLIEGFRKSGEEFLQKLEGIFAGVIYDVKKGEIILFRDKLGLNPLFYTLNQGKIIFSSYIRPLLLVVERKLNPLALDSVYRFGFNVFLETLWKDVYELGPGEILYFSSKGLKKNKYYRLEDFVSEKESFLEDELDFYLQESASLREPAFDYGLFISAGVDSNLTLTYLSPKGSFTYDGENEEFGEYKFLKEKKIDGIFRLNPEIFTALQKEVVLKEEEVHGDLSFFVLYGLGKLAKNSGLKVVFTGDMADELFLGYQRDWDFLQKYGYSVDEVIVDRESFFKNYFSHFQHADEAVLTQCFNLNYSQEQFFSYLKEELWDYFPSGITAGKALILLNLRVLYMKNNRPKTDRMLLENGVEGRSLFHHLPLVEKVISTKTLEVLTDVRKSKLLKLLFRKNPSYKSLPKKYMPTVVWGEWWRQGKIVFHLDKENSFYRREKLENIKKEYFSGNNKNYYLLRLIYILSLWEKIFLQGKLPLN